MLDASVIMPSHNRGELLEYSLVYLLNQTVDNYEIILIDDASTDGTDKIISKIKDFTPHQSQAWCGARKSKLRYIKLKHQSGPYVARNIGIKEAKGNIIIFTDSDVLAHPRFVEDHIKIHKRYDKIILQGMVHHIKHPGWFSFRFYFPNAIFFGLFVSQNTSVHRNYMLEVGGFDENLGGLIGFKDIEVGLRLQKIGLKYLYGIRTCMAYHVDKPYGRERLTEYFHKNYERGYSAACFVAKHGKLAENIARTKRTLFFSKFYNTEAWVENESTLKTIERMIDSPLIPLFPFWRKVAKYHYRAKGIKKANKRQTSDHPVKSLRSNGASRHQTID
ncbi:glycosyltransferase family 2 protein [candidate division WOR-3 bacterium]|nr:glycosyltransferase family 2 protein [candidate division WOR-3 bacterium]